MHRKLFIEREDNAMDEKYEFQVGNRDCNDTAIVIADWDNDTDDEDD